MSFKSKAVAGSIALLLCAVAGPVAAQESTVEGPSYYNPEVRESGVFALMPDLRPINIIGYQNVYISARRRAAAQTPAERRALYAPPKCDTSGLLTPEQIYSKLQLCHDVEFNVDHSP